MNYQKMYERLLEKLTSEKLWDAVLNATIEILVIMILSYTVVLVGRIFIAKVFILRMKAPIQHSERRQQTILRLLQSVLSYVVYFSAILAILSAVNIDIAGLLAGAGIAGLAIGFGAQSLVKDIITGFFIIFEDQFGVGDYIQLNGASGTVIEIGLRTTKIKGLNGEMHIIPNGAIGEVVNFSISNSIAIVDIGIAYNADIELAEKLVQQYLDGLQEQYEEIVDAPKLLGMLNIVGAEVTMRITVETLPMQHHKISRIIRKDVKDIFDSNGIDIPYPQMMIYDRDKTKSNIPVNGAEAKK